MNPVGPDEKNINAVNAVAAAEEEKKRELSDAEKLAEEVNNLFWEIISLCLEEEGQTPFDPTSEAGKERINSLKGQYENLRERYQNLNKEGLSDIDKSIIEVVKIHLNSLNGYLELLERGALGEMQRALHFHDELAQNQLNNPQHHQMGEEKEEKALQPDRAEVGPAEEVEGGRQPQRQGAAGGPHPLYSDIFGRYNLCVGTVAALIILAVILILTRVVPKPADF